MTHPNISLSINHTICFPNTSSRHEKKQTNVPKFEWDRVTPVVLSIIRKNPNNNYHHNPVPIPLSNQLSTRVLYHHQKDGRRGGGGGEGGKGTGQKGSVHINTRVLGDAPFPRTDT